MMKKVPFSKLVLLAVSCASCFLVLEISTRVWLEFFASRKHQFRYSRFEAIPQSQRRWSPHPHLDYYPTPNYRRRLTSHNSLGYRDREFSKTKPAGVFRIVALGGSTTYTVNVADNEKMFTRQLENELKNRLDHAHVEVINAGAAGFDSWQSLINLQFRVLDLDPDLVMIYHGVNDIHTRLVEPGSYQGDNLGRRKEWEVPRERFWEYSAFARLVSRVTNWTPRPRGLGRFVNAPSYLGPGSGTQFWQREEAGKLLAQHPPIYFERNLINMIAIARAHDVGVVLPTFAFSAKFGDYAASKLYRDALAESNDVVRGVARRFDVPLFEFGEVMPDDAEYWFDGRHVNEVGAAEKGRLFADFLDSENLIHKQ
jgi:lysophospholipase L1-like esterase